MSSYCNRSQIHATLITFFAQPQNFIVATERDKVNNAVMRFRRGHPFLRFMLAELVSNFKSSKWGNQGGPKLIGVRLTVFNIMTWQGLFHSVTPYFRDPSW